jgi:ketosteroid isomerase-like protein
MFFEFTEVLMIGSPQGVARTLQIFYFGLGIVIAIFSICLWLIDILSRLNESNKAIVISFIKAINDHDVDKIVNLMSEDHIFIDARDNKLVGKKAMKEGWEGYFKLFPDYKIEVSDIIENESVIGLFGYAGATCKNLRNKTNINSWRIPVSLKAIVEKNKIKHWQVFCDYSDLI